MKVLGIDPGETAGYALIEVDTEKPELTKVVSLGQFRQEKYEEWAEEWLTQADMVVMEDYRVYGHMASRHAGDRLITARMLGKVESHCKQNDKTFILQMADILPVAQKWTQMKMPKNHKISHQVSAYNHAMFYLIKKKWALSALAMTRKANNG